MVLPWLSQNARQEHYFVHINYWDAHHPCKMDVSWADRFDGTAVRQDWPDEQTIQEHRSYEDGGFGFSATKLSGKDYPLMPDTVGSRRDFEMLITGYDAAIAYVDHHVGIVLDELDRQGVLAETAIIVSADHGDAFGQHGIYASHLCADECIHQIPLIIRWPGITGRGGSCDELLYNVDLAPTLCELIGVQKPKEWDGLSFAPYLKGTKSPGRECLVWDHGLQVLQRGVRTRTHLMLKTYDCCGRSGFEPLELYDMECDPYQIRNICDMHPDIVAGCEKYLDEWLEEQNSKTAYGPDPLEAILEERGHRRKTRAKSS